MADDRLNLLEDLLRRDGPLTAAALAAALGISQPTVSRRLASAGERIVRIGKARSSRYALAHDIGRAGSRWPLYRIDSQGRSEALGELSALHGGGFHFAPARPIPAFLHGDFAAGDGFGHCVQCGECGAEDDINIVLCADGGDDALGESFGVGLEHIEFPVAGNDGFTCHDRNP